MSIAKLCVHFPLEREKKKKSFGKKIFKNKDEKIKFLPQSVKYTLMREH